MDAVWWLLLAVTVIWQLLFITIPRAIAAEITSPSPAESTPEQDAAGQVRADEPSGSLPDRSIGAT